MSSIIEELELKAKKAHLASFSPQYLNQLKRSGKDVDQIKDINETLLIEWNDTLLDKYDGRALLATEDLVRSRSADSLRQQQKPNEKYEEDVCDIYRYEDFMNILGDSYLTPNQDLVPGSGSTNQTDSSFKTVGWSYNNDNIEDRNSTDNITNGLDTTITEVPIKQEPIQQSTDQKELIIKELQEISTNINDLMANQANLSEGMIKSLVDNEDLTQITQHLKAVNEFTTKLNEKLKQPVQEQAIEWKPAIEVPLSIQVPEDEAQNKIIERTAQFFKSANKEQIEKFKEAQASNEKLAFLKPDHALHQYFEFLLKPEQQQVQMVIMQKLNEEKRQHLEKIVQEQKKIQEERKKIEQEALVPKKIVPISDPPFEIKMFIQIVVRLIRKYGQKFEEMLRQEEKDNKNFDFFHEDSPLRQYFEDQKKNSTSKTNINVNKTDNPSVQKSEEEIKNARKRKMKDFLASLEAKGEISIGSNNNTNTNTSNKDKDDSYERENKRQKLV